MSLPAVHWVFEKIMYKGGRASVWASPSPGSFLAGSQRGNSRWPWSQVSGPPMSFVSRYQLPIVSRTSHGTATTRPSSSVARKIWASSARRVRFLVYSMAIYETILTITPSRRRRRFSPCCYTSLQSLGLEARAE